MTSSNKPVKPQMVVVPVRMTSQERDLIDDFYRKSVYKSRSQFILAVLQEKLQP